MSESGWNIPGKILADRQRERILRLGQIQRHRAVEGVDDDLDGVADVVARTARTGRGCRVRIVGRARIRVLDPEDLAVAQDRIRIGIEGQERREQPHAVGDPPVEQDATFRRELARDENVGIGELDREEQAPQEPADRHATGAFVERRFVVLAARIVELGLFRADEDVAVRELAEVDARLVDSKAFGRDRRQIADVEHRQALGGDLIDRAQCQTVPVRERQPLVHPGPVLNALGVQLAHREHHLARLAFDVVPVVVNVDEVVVGPDFLNLSERLQQRLMVPEPDVFNRPGVADDVLRRQLGVARELALLDTVERVGAPRRFDVMDDERLFLVLFVRRDDQPLQNGAIQAARHRHPEVQPDGDAERPGVPAEAVPERQTRAGGEHDERRPEKRKRRVDVRVRRAECNGGCRLREERARQLEPGAPRHQAEDDRAQDPQVTARGGNQPDPRPERDAMTRFDDEAPGQHVGQTAADERQHGRDHRLLTNDLEDGQLEDVERDVAIEERIALAKRHRVERAEPGEPVRRTGEARARARRRATATAPGVRAGGRRRRSVSRRCRCRARCADAATAGWPAGC